MTRDPAEGKLDAKWEGPYRVVKCHKKGAYRLESREGKPVLRAWNAEHLKKVLHVILKTSPFCKIMGIWM
jgi:hypothetical protein